MRMKKSDYLIFLNSININKPNDFYGNCGKCPFCDRKKLKGILKEDGPFLLIENKYNTLKNTRQLIIVETYDCSMQMGDYSEEYMKKLMRFSIENWLELEKSEKYKSVIFYKNHGIRSGGSLKHPHMQIVGLHTIDYKENIKKENFDGISIFKSKFTTVNLSTKPINGFCEFNIIMEDTLKSIDEFSCNIRKVVDYILNHYFAPCDSFNLFFYHYDKKVICKVMPRFVTSPLVLGYKIKQISDEIEEIAKKMKRLYF